MSFHVLSRALVCVGATLVLSDPAPANSLTEPGRAKDRNVRVVNAGQTTGGIPAGMVLVEGGRFTMGLGPKEMDSLVESLGVEDGENVGFMPIISAWYPDHQVEIGDLLVDQYEFTNLQYQMYLEARGMEPTQDLLDWHWFSFNSKGEKEPGLTEAKHNLPVRAITGKDADRASRWVGKRLPTEAEWEYFARKGAKPDQYYPWSEGGLKGWDKDKCSNSSNSMTREGIETSVGGSFPEDQNLQIFDLCGNVTEWTSSPFLPYPGWKPYEVKVRKKKRSFRSEFSAEHWAIRGGNCRGTEVSNLTISRQPWHPNSLAEYVGFRCVLSALPGLDVLRDAEEHDLTLMQRDLKGMLDFQPEAIAAQLIHDVDPDSRLVAQAEHLAFTRIKESTYNSDSVLEKASIDEPVAVGILVTSQPMASPELPAGSYVVYFKAAGLSKAQKEARRAAEEAEKAKKEEERKGGGKDEDEDEDEDKDKDKDKDKKDAQEEEAPEQEDAEAPKAAEKLGLLELPTDQDILLIKSEADEIVAWLPAEREKAKPHATRFSYTKGAGKATRTTAAAAGPSDVQGTNDQAWFQFTVKAGSGGNQMQFNLKLEFAPGSFEPVSMPAEEQASKGRSSGRRR